MATRCASEPPSRTVVDGDGCGLDAADSTSHRRRVDGPSMSVSTHERLSASRDTVIDSPNQKRGKRKIVGEQGGWLRADGRQPVFSWRCFFSVFRACSEAHERYKARGSRAGTS